ncbi:MAG: hypothetical protein ABH860_02040 [bacterium]
MKRTTLMIMLVISLCDAAHAGFLSGNSSPYIRDKGSYAVNLNSSIIMVGTPFSSVCLSGKYGYDDKLNLCAKYGVGTIDYSTVSGIKLTNDPQLSAFGFEYILDGTREAQYNAFVVEYETISWSINRRSNISNELLLGCDFSALTKDEIRTRYRIAIHNFNAGIESEEKISTSVKYSLSTEVNYSFSSNIKGNFEAGIYFGDPIGGIIALFGLGIGFNS